MAKKKFPLYLVSVLLFMLIFPLASIWIELLRSTVSFGWPLAGKWFIFWGAGARLFIAGIRQVTKPAFTAKEIFNMSGTESFSVIRELGFANISVGLIALLSLFVPSFRLPAAVCGGLYFGMAGLLHCFKIPDSRNEVIALFSDLFIFLLLAAYAVCTAI